MKHVNILLLSMCLLTGMAVQAQGLLKSLGRKAAAVAGDRAVDKAVNAAANKAVLKKKASSADEGENADPAQDQENQSTSPARSETIAIKKEVKAYSKFDFVPGDKIIFAEDFQQDVIGEFPLKWFTNGSGEIVELEGYQGKWLMPKSGSILSPVFTTPSDFTFEFDMFVNLDLKGTAVLPGFQFELFANGDKAKRLGYDLFPMTNRISFDNNYSGANLYVRMESLENKARKATGKTEMMDWSKTNFGTMVHVALWVQNERVRMWFNNEKIFDNPNAVAVDAKFNQLLLSAPKKRDGQAGCYLGNFKLAVGAPDTRNKLLVEGKFSTTGILFDAGSDVIRQSSSGTLKEIAGLLKSDPSLRFRIVGHTDGDGNAASNLVLSGKRAQAVKAALVADYGISADHLETEGMGDKKPVADNKTSLGKAQNRRVEFVRLDK